MTFGERLTALLEILIVHLDIPQSYYKKAVDRHRSLESWLCREGSSIARLRPHVSAQGSFRYGTVIRPLVPIDEYDLDNVTRLHLSKNRLSQRELKQLYGAEIKLYAAQANMKADPEEKNRCWRLRYADEVKFHVDTLPCIPEDPRRIGQLEAMGVLPSFAKYAIAITDRSHSRFRSVTVDWPSSNPRGFAEWFELKARSGAVARIKALTESRQYRSADDIPPYELKSALQRSIQILKRHRDVMFIKNADLAPISMIITNLATHAYEGETDLWQALSNIAERMPRFIQRVPPYVPNPADPAEDYADRWSTNPLLKRNFELWLAQVALDIPALMEALQGGTIERELERRFKVELTLEDASLLSSGSGTSATAGRAVSVPYFSPPPRPWAAGA